MPPPSTAFPSVVHPFPSPTNHSCAYETGIPTSQNALLFVGGLGDGPHTVPYVRAISGRLEAEARRGSDEESYSVFEIRMASSFSGFGHSSLAQDVADISGLVAYLRSIGRRRVVLMGHSTGCQDCMEYAKRGESPVDGFILQGPVSDREAFTPLMGPEDLQRSLAAAKKMLDEGRGNECMLPADLPSAFETPMTAYRWFSLASERGDDDYFSSDLPDEFLREAWGAFAKPVLIVPSGEEEYVPTHVDKASLLGKWMALENTTISPLSALIPGANHTVDEGSSQEWLAERVAQFLKALE